MGQRTDGEYGASLWKFDPRAEKFTFYPKPQRHADSPKIQITGDGAVWYSPRGSREAPAFGVLYPDMDEIDSLGAFYTYGPPGIRFRRRLPQRPREGADAEPLNLDVTDTAINFPQRPREGADPEPAGRRRV